MVEVVAQTRQRRPLAVGTTLVLLLGVLTTTSAAQHNAYSSLWGRNGEQYRSLAKGGRLVDYSYVGYNAGETGLPTKLVPTHDVRKFGAKGDGRTDDSNAFQRAIAALGQGDVLRIPAGKYAISQQFAVQKGVYIVGDGSDKTTLIVTKGAPDAQFYFTGKVVTPATKLTDIASFPKKGTNDVNVRSAARVRVGDWVVATMGTPNGGDLFLNMNKGVDKGCDDDFCKAPYAFLHFSRVAKIAGNTITLERPFSWDLEPTFKPLELHAYRPTMRDFGIQGLHFLCKSGRYAGHMKETGFVNIKMDGVANGFVRDIRGTDVDIGVQIARSAFVTVSGIVLDATAGRPQLGHPYQVTGHHGITVAATDALIEDFTFNTRFIHDVGNDKFATGQVFQNGRGIDTNLDCHKAQNYANLFANINIGAGTRALDSSGATNRGDHAGAFTTYWNIQTSKGQGWKSKYFRVPGFGPYLQWVGIPANSYFPSLNTKESKTWLIEEMAPSDLYPSNVYAAMKAIRMSSPGKVSSLLGGKGRGGKLLSQM